MTDEEVFKRIIHSDEAFTAFVETHGHEKTMGLLNGMNMRVNTQIAKYGDERPDWYARAKRLSVVVRGRIDEVKNLSILDTDVWKNLAGDLAEVILLNHGDNFEGELDYDSPQSLRDFLDSTGL